MRNTLPLTMFMSVLFCFERQLFGSRDGLISGDAVLTCFCTGVRAGVLEASLCFTARRCPSASLCLHILRGAIPQFCVEPVMLKPTCGRKRACIANGRG